MPDDKEEKEAEEDAVTENAHQEGIELTCENCGHKYKVVDSSDCPECSFDNFEQMEDKIA